MDMDNKRGKRQAASIFGGMGFYIALLVCVVAAGVVGYYALLGSKEPPVDVEVLDDVPVEKADPAPAQPVARPAVKPALPVIREQPVRVPRPAAVIPELEETGTEETGTEETAEPARETAAPEPAPDARLEVVSPLAGETVAVFSVDKLTYDATLGDWRTHDGVDIRAAAGSAVAAAAAGTVRSVEEDGRLGTMVVIEHQGGYTTTYASLLPETEVQAGDTVRAGTVIGAVGNTSLSESALGAHLHFAVARDGVAVDPEEFLG